jgi:hypothetical protein
VILNTSHKHEVLRYRIPSAPGTKPPLAAVQIHASFRGADQPPRVPPALVRPCKAEAGATGVRLRAVVDDASSFTQRAGIARTFGQGSGLVRVAIESTS